ncbi:acetyl-CoA acetyltransferase [Citrobacter koseri]|nr:acetyl-CoA acetyltransferase [Citrobacter koseri]
MALAAQAIQAGQAQAIVAGGMENMSQAPYLLDAKARWGYRLGDGQLSDVILRDGLICATHGYHMGDHGRKRRPGIRHQPGDAG